MKRIHLSITENHAMHYVQEYSPSIRNQRFVESLWISESPVEAINRVLPDGCTDIILPTAEQGRGSFSGSYFVGPMTMAECVNIQPDTCLVGIRFRPGTLLKSNHLPVSLRDQTIPVPLEYSSFLSSLQTRHRYSALNLIDDLEHWITHLAQDNEFIRDPEVDCVLEALQDNPATPLHSFYQSLNVSPRTIERRFLKMVGMTPKFFARVQRHLCAANALSITDNPLSLSALAQNLHYADQAHFIRDFTSLAGITPGEYQIEQRN
jgi:AraC-like DNA-binding protein